MRNDLDMVEGRETSAFVRLMGMVDTANGIVTRASPREWAFPNLDLNIDLLRLPGDHQGRDRTAHAHRREQRACLAIAAEHRDRQHHQGQGREVRGRVHRP